MAQTKEYLISVYQHAMGLSLPVVCAAMATSPPERGGIPALLWGVSASLFGAAAAIWQNRRAAAMDRKEENDEQEARRLFNHDIAKSVASAIGSIVKRVAVQDDLPAQHRAALSAIAANAESAWLEVASAADPGVQPMLEQSVIAAVTVNPQNPEFPLYGDLPMWRRALRAMLDEVGRNPGLVLPEDSIALNRAAEACQKDFSRQFFDELKHDLSNPKGGAAFAGVHLRMMGDLVLAARAGAVNDRELNKKVDAIVDAISSRGDELVAVIEKTGGQREVIRLRPVTSWLKRIDGKLGRIDRRVHDVIVRLQALQEQGVRTEHVVRAGFVEARKREDVAHTITRRKLGLLSAASATIVVLATIGGLVVAQRRTREQAVAARQALAREIRKNVDVADLRVGLLSTIADQDLWPASNLGDVLRVQRDAQQQHSFNHEAFAVARTIPSLAVLPEWSAVETFYEHIKSEGLPSSTMNGTMQGVEQLLLQKPAPSQTLVCEAVGHWVESVEAHCHLVGMLAQLALQATSDDQPIRDFKYLPLASGTAGDRSPSARIASKCSESPGPLQQTTCLTLQNEFERLDRSKRDDVAGVAAKARAVGCYVTARSGYRRIIEWFADDPTWASYAKIGLDQLDSPESYKRLRGAFVSGYAETSPGRDAGILVGDLIIKYSDFAIDTVEDLYQALTSNYQDSMIEVVVIRSRAPVAIRCPVGRLGLEVAGY